MSARQFRTAAIPTLILLAGGALLVLQLPGGGRLRAANSSLPPTDPNMMTRVIATHPRVELVEQRDDHTRVWEIVKEVETTHPDGTTTVDTVKSYIHEKGSGLCYKDPSGSYVPAVAEWRETPDGFVMDRCGYKLSIGKTVGSWLVYTFEGHRTFLRPVFITVSDGTVSSTAAALNPDAQGFIAADSASTLSFPGALGDGSCVELVVDKGGFHQSVVLTVSLELPAAMNPAQAEMAVWTELDLSDYAYDPACRARVGDTAIDWYSRSFAAERRACDEIVFNRVVDNLEGAVRETPMWCFTGSDVLDCSTEQLTRTRGELVREGETGRTYLAESTPYRSSEVGGELQIRGYVIVNQPITQQETWEPRYTYQVTAALTVWDATLSILPGTTVKLDPLTGDPRPPSIRAAKRATIVARGEPYNHVVFTKSSDNNCGEPIPQPPAGPWWIALRLDSVCSDQSVIQCCKFSYSDGRGIHVRRTLIEAISHNIFAFEDNPDGICLEGCSATIHANLISGCKHGVYALYPGNRNYTNNTFASCGLVEGGDGICDTSSSGTFWAADNLFSNCDHGIYTGNPAGNSHHNRFYNVTTPVTGGSGYDNIVLDTDPHDHTCALGDFFLNYNNDEVWEKLIDNGSRTAQAAGLGNDVFSVFPPITLLSGARTGSETWTKIAADSPTSYVDIGYHHNRVDRYIPGTVSFSGTGWLTVSPGATVAMAGGFHPRLHFYSGGGMTSVGSETGSSLISGYNVFADARSVSMHIEAPQFASWNSPYLLIYSDASDQTRMEFTRFNWLTYGIRTYRSFANEIKHNLFFHCGLGLFPEGCPGSPKNNLFYRNWAGIYAWDSNLNSYNNTFDTNNVGIYYDRYPGKSLTVKDNLFTDFTPQSILSDPDLLKPERAGIALYGSEQGTFIQSHNGYYGNAHDIYDHQSQTDVTPESYSRLFLASPYDAKKPAWQAEWFLKQAADPGEEPTRYIAVDAGSRSASDAGLSQFTTSKTGQLDAGTVDMGFHHRPSS